MGGVCHSFSNMFGFSTYGYRADDMKTYSMVSGLIHGGTSLGAGLAPVLSGFVNQYLNFDWYATGSAIMSAFMVSTLT